MLVDVLNSDAFSVASLTDAITNLKFMPGRIGQMGLFSETGVATTTIYIEQKGGLLSLVPPSARGGVGTTIDKSKRDMRSLIVPHFELNGGVTAEEVQSIRPFGQETGLETVMAKVNEHMTDMGNALEVTMEHARIGAVKGVVEYANGSTLDLFAEFGVTKETIVNFDLQNASPAEGALRRKCQGVVRQAMGILDGLPMRGLRAFCGDNFFDDLLAHKEVRDTYKNWSDAQILREGYIEPNGMSYGAFEFGGIIWENYRGSVGGATFVDTDACHIFPEGVPGLFRTYYAPADLNETVNTIGRPRYARMYATENGKGYHLDVQMNALNICTRPKVLIEGIND